MHIVALEFTADGPELEHAEIERQIERMINEFERELAERK
jgi:hypothetical protein